MTLKSPITKPSAAQCTGPREPRVVQILLPSSARRNNVRAYYPSVTIRTSATTLHRHYPQVRTRRQTRLRDTVNGPRLHPLDIPCQPPLQQPCKKASYRSPAHPPVFPAAQNWYPPFQVVTTGVQRQVFEAYPAHEGTNSSLELEIFGSTKDECIHRQDAQPKSRTLSTFVVSFLRSST